MGSGNELGNLSGEMRGTVIRAEHVELVLAEIPEQTWMWDELVDARGGSTIDITIPMRLRREIIALVLGASTRLPL